MLLNVFLLRRLSRTIPPLVSPLWLQHHKAAENIVIIEAKLPSMQPDSLGPTIGGSFPFNIDGCCDTATSLPHMLPSPSTFEEYVSKLGIRNDTHVIVYDNWPQIGFFSSPRVWWMFHIFGHDNISVLDGGLPAWESEGLPVSYLESYPKSFSSFKSKFDMNYVKTLSQVKENAKTGTAALVDARSSERFYGMVPEPRPGLNRGHIPNSLNLPFVNLIDPSNKCFVSNSRILSEFKRSGIDLSSPLWCTCGSGVTACVLSFASYLCGFGVLPIYDGSWTEWSQQIDLATNNS